MLSRIRAALQEPRLTRAQCAFLDGLDFQRLRATDPVDFCSRISYRPIEKQGFGEYGSLSLVWHIQESHNFLVHHFLISGQHLSNKTVGRAVPALPQRLHNRPREVFLSFLFDSAAIPMPLHWNFPMCPPVSNARQADQYTMDVRTGTTWQGRPLRIRLPSAKSYSQVSVECCPRYDMNITRFPIPKA